MSRETHEFLAIGNRRWCLGCNLEQAMEPPRRPGYFPIFPMKPLTVCARFTPYAVERDNEKPLVRSTDKGL